LIYKINQFDLSTKYLKFCDGVQGKAQESVKFENPEYIPQMWLSLVCPAHVVDGISYWQVMFTGHIQSYSDVHRYRLGC
jgi:hypothetical protein